MKCYPRISLYISSYFFVFFIPLYFLSLLLVFFSRARVFLYFVILCSSRFSHFTAKRTKTCKEFYMKDKQIFEDIFVLFS